MLTLEPILAGQSLSYNSLSKPFDGYSFVIVHQLIPNSFLIPDTSAFASNKKRSQCSLTATQFTMLENEYRVQPFPCKADLGNIAWKLDLTESQVKSWFHFRRVKDRKHRIKIDNQTLESTESPDSSIRFVRPRIPETTQYIQPSDTSAQTGTEELTIGGHKVIDIRPETEDIEPQIIVIEPEVIVIKPQVTDKRPEVIDLSTEEFDYRKEIIYFSIEEMDIRTEETDRPQTPQNSQDTQPGHRQEFTFAEPEVIDIRPEIIDITPDIRVIEPEYPMQL